MLRLPELRRRTVVLTTSAHAEPKMTKPSKRIKKKTIYLEDLRSSERTAASATASGTDVEQKACEKAIAASIAYYGKSKKSVYA